MVRVLTDDEIKPALEREIRWDEIWSDDEGIILREECSEDENDIITKW